MNQDVNLATFAADIDRAFLGVTNGELDWALFGYHKGTPDLYVVETGKDGLDGLVDSLDDGKLLYALLRVRDDNTQLFKYVFISWCPEGVPVRQKSMLPMHRPRVLQRFKGIHVQIDARSLEDIKKDAVMRRVRDASGAKYTKMEEESPSMTRSSSFASSANANTNFTSAPSNTTSFTSTPSVPVAPRIPPPRPNIAQIDPSSATSSIVTSAQRIAEIKALTQQRPSLSSDSPETNSQRTPEQDRQDELKKIAAMRKNNNFMNEVKNEGKEKEKLEQLQREKELKEKQEKELKEKQERELKEKRERELKEKQERELKEKQEREQKEKLQREKENQEREQKEKLQREKEKQEKLQREQKEKEEREKQQQQSQSNNSPSAIALYDYEAVESNELSLLAGHRIINVQTIDEGWWFGKDEQTGAEGLFPANYVQLEEHKVENLELKKAEEQRVAEEKRQAELKAEEERLKKVEMERLKKEEERQAELKRMKEEEERKREEVKREELKREEMKREEERKREELKREEMKREEERKREELKREEERKREAKKAEEERQRQEAKKTEERAKLASNQKDGTAQVLFDYDAAEENEISLSVDEIITEIVAVDEGWWFGTSPSGHRGLFPSNYVKALGAINSATEPDTNASSTLCAKALYDYTAQEDNELSFQVDQIINHVQQVSDDWWQGEVAGQVGLFPANYVALI